MLEANAIYKRDCIEGMKDLAPGSVDLVFADPPFNIGYDYDVYDDAREAEHYLDWSQQWIEGAYSVLKPAGTFWLAIGDEYAAELKMIAKKIGFTCRSWVIWYYTFGVNCKQKFSRSHAHLFHFIKDPEHFTFNDQAIRVPSARQLVYADSRANPTGRLPDDTWILRPQDVPNGFSAGDDTWYFPRVAGTFKERAGFHGCQMPEQLLGRIIRACSHPEDLVLDPFSGSATTLVVAKKLGRRWVGFDLSADYIKRGRERLAEAKVGEVLVGAPEPLVSAPATPVENLKGPGASGKFKKAKQVVDKKKKIIPPPIASARRTISPTGAAKATADFEAGIVEAFLFGGGGFSADRVVADEGLNAAFADRCRELGLAGGEGEWNRALFRMRKAGKLSHVTTNRRTEFDWMAADRYLYAGEIALARMEAQGLTLDEVLCDPDRRREFDETARSFAPGFTPFEYRWGALGIRKIASQSLAKAAALKNHKLLPAQDLFEIPLRQFRNAAGLYLLSTEISANGKGSALYAGVTLDIEKRLRLLLDGCRLSACWQAFAKSGRIAVQILELDAPAGENWLSELAPHQARLVSKLAPVLNFKNATDAKISHGGVSG